MLALTCPRCGGPVDPESGCPEHGTPPGGDPAADGGDHASAHADPRETPRKDPLIGQRLGKYQVERVIGRGGMGTVYRAQHVELGSPAAIKLLDKRFLHERETVARFFREARTAAQIGHINIVRVLDFVEDPALGAYIVMELLEGKTLARLLRHRKRLDQGDAVAIALQLCEALAAAHHLGVIHRDLKPANVFLTRSTGKEVVKLMDFGVAKVAEGANVASTQPGVAMGTPLYMSPEQWDDVEIDQRSDIYQMGVLLYEMLTGQPPFQGTTTRELLKAHTVGEPPRPSTLNKEIAASLEAVVMRCLKKEPAERFQTVRDVAAALRGEHTDWVPFSSVLAKERGIGRWTAIGLSLAVVVLVALVTWLYARRPAAEHVDERPTAVPTATVPSSALPAAAPTAAPNPPPTPPPTTAPAAAATITPPPAAAPTPRPAMKKRSQKKVDLLFGE